MNSFCTNLLSIIDTFVDNTTSVVKEWTGYSAKEVVSYDHDFLDEMEKGIVDVWIDEKKHSHVEMIPLPVLGQSCFQLSNTAYIDKIILKRIYPLYDIEAGMLAPHHLREIVIV